MSSLESLLAAVLANPDDDAPRLAFAAFLEWVGETNRAEFIRKQIELHRVPEWDPLRVRAEHFEPESLWGFKQPRPELPSPMKWCGRECFKRGFPAAVDVWKAEAFAHRLPEVREMAPVDTVFWWGCRPNDFRGYPHWHTLCGEPGTKSIRRLELPLGRLADDDLAILNDSPHACNLVDFGLSTCELARHQVVDLLRLDRFRQLEVLAFRVVDEGEGDVPAAVADFAGRQLRNLRVLHTHRSRSSYLWEPGFLDSPLFRGLRHLDLSENLFGAGDADRLAGSGALDGLESLTLKFCVGGDGLAYNLAACPGLSRLGRLKLDQNALGPSAAKALAASPHLKNLRVLTLTDNPIGDEGLIAIAQSPFLANLVHLDLVFCGIGDAGARALLESPLANSLIYAPIPRRGHGGVRKDHLSPEMERRLSERFEPPLS